MICCDDFEKRHIKDCYKKATDEGGLIVLPEKGSVMSFKNHKNMLERPYNVHCRFRKYVIKK